MKVSSKKGFTLIELLVVIAIIGILSTMATVAVGNAREKARDAVRQSDMNSIATAIQMYYTENNTYPIDAASTPAVDACGDAGVIAPAVDQPVCSDIAFKDSSEIYIERLPQYPTNSADQRYIYDNQSDAGSYCIEVNPVERYCLSVALNHRLR
ncbi:type II secretion system protein [Candidatus Parcubacteria bacterium]|nr:type II secretion system protein [Candidatus Parcubacteria bacterium]